MNLDQFDSFLKILDKIQGLSAVALVFFLCLAVGYAWRSIKFKWFPNDAIPMVVMGTGSLVMSFIASGRPNDMPSHVWVVRNLVVGFIIGALAWLVHNYALSKLENWLASKFPGLNDTAFFKKDKDQDIDQNPPKP